MSKRPPSRLRQIRPGRQRTRLFFFLFAFKTSNFCFGKFRKFLNFYLKINYISCYLSYIYINV